MSASLPQFTVLARGVLKFTKNKEGEKEGVNALPV